MVVDDKGRAYVGNFGWDLHGGGESQPATLVLVGADGAPRIVAEDLDGTGYLERLRAMAARDPAVAAMFDG